MDFVKSSSSNEAKVKLSQWLELVKQCKIREFSYLARTILNWKQELLILLLFLILTAVLKVLTIRSKLLNVMPLVLETLAGSETGSFIAVHS